MPAFYLNKEYMEQVVGKGISLIEPYVLDSRDAKWKINSVAGEKKINESIRNILSTRIGERMFVPMFGSRLHEVLFEQNDMICRDLIIHYTIEAIQTWEKRIVVDHVDVTEPDDNNRVEIKIYYHFANSNINGSYVYPFNLSQDGEIETYSYLGGRTVSGFN